MYLEHGTEPKPVNETRAVHAVGRIHAQRRAPDVRQGEADFVMKIRLKTAAPGTGVAAARTYPRRTIHQGVNADTFKERRAKIVLPDNPQGALAYVGPSSE